MAISAPAHPDGYAMQPASDIALTEECRHYKKKNEVPWDLQKYFAQRYSVFSLYDDGVYMTDDAWFGVTPEPVAIQVANDMMARDSTKSVIVDLFAGAGGNTISFALASHWDRVIAVEKDAATLACAQHNAQLYGVEPGHITWVHGDSFDFMARLESDPVSLHPDLRIAKDTTVLFASPPWGGPGYTSDEIFDLNTMQPYALGRLHGAYRSFDHALFLPRTSDIKQVAKLVPNGEKVEVVQYCVEGASKAMVTYIPGQPAAPGTRAKRPR